MSSPKALLRQLQSSPPCDVHLPAMMSILGTPRYIALASTYRFSSLVGTQGPVNIVKIPRREFGQQLDDPLNRAIQQELVAAVQAFMDDPVSRGADQPGIVRVAYPATSGLTTPLPFSGRLGECALKQYLVDGFSVSDRA